MVVVASGCFKGGGCPSPLVVEPPWSLSSSLGSRILLVSSGPPKRRPEQTSAGVELGLVSCSSSSP